MLSYSIKKFDNDLSKLNKEQREAVETIEGAVMVLAGPGTGKTQVVALRIANILKRTQMNPANILALTFTESGVTALKERLISIIGRQGYKVTIGTFHSFSSEVIAIFPHLFAKTKELRQISDAERFLLIEEILNSDDSLKHIRPIRKPDHYVGEIGQKIKSLKQEAISPDNLVKIIKESDNVARLKELASVYRQYNEQLSKRGWYDYEDTIELVVDALKNNEEVRAYFQEKYQYILVDEYQDTNNSQNQLVETLADFYENPNLFVVGDDKQAIYRFQGASVANMLHFKKKYPQMKTISLKTNYRSSPQILALSEKLISNNKKQIDQSFENVTVRLQAVSNNSEKPTLYRAASELEQYSKIIKLVKGYEKSGTPLSAIAILWRKRRDVKSFAEFALKSGVAVSGQVVKQIFEDPTVNYLIKLLKAVNKPQNNMLVISAIKPTLSDRDLVELYKLNRASKSSTLIISKLFDGSANIKKQLAIILEANQLAELIAVKELIEWLNVNSEYLGNTYRKKDLAGVEALLALHQLAANFSNQDNSKLEDFLLFLNTVKERGLDISMTKLLPEKGLYTGTVHSVKGMEFDRVIVAGVDEKRWSTKRRPESLRLPSKVVGLDRWEGNEEEDERRLFYVAVTRARKTLDLIYSKLTNDSKDVLASQFVEEIIDKLKIKNVEENNSIDSARKFISAASKNIISKQELEYARGVIESSPFSFSDLRAYNICPKQYYLSRVLKLPQPESEALMYGNVIHGALEVFFREFRSYKTMPSKKRFLELVGESALKNSAAGYQKQISKHSLDIMSEYYDKKSSGWKIPVGIEYSFTHRQVRLGNIWLTGKYDRMDIIDAKSRTVRVVDYKTKSRFISRNEIEGNTKTSDGSIKKQLVFYGLIAKNDSTFPYTVKDFMVSVIDDTKKFRDEVISISSSEISSLEKEIIDTKKEILSLKSFDHTRESFDKGCELCEIYS